MPDRLRARPARLPLTDATYDLPQVNLSSREVFSFSLAREMLHAFEGTPLEISKPDNCDEVAEAASTLVRIVAWTSSCESACAAGAAK